MTPHPDAERTEWSGRPFQPAWWLPGGHTQTLAGKFLRPRSVPPLERRRIETPDGDFLDLDFSVGGDSSRPLVIVLHGLEGHSRRGYALSSYSSLERAGLAAVGLNFRSCSGEPNRRPRFYHSGDTDDLAFVLGYLSERFPRRVLGAIGFSLGGNVLLKGIGEPRDDGPLPLRAAAAISVPYDLSAGASLLEESMMGRIYSEYFLRRLKGKARQKRGLLDGVIDVEATLSARSLRAFDDVATAPLHGFADANDYYSRSSSGGFLKGIRTPTFLIHSRDDPFLPESALPTTEVEDNPFISMKLTARGGHVGFVEGSIPSRAHFWAEDEAARFLAAHLDAIPAEETFV